MYACEGGVVEVVGHLLEQSVAAKTKINSLITPVVLDSQNEAGGTCLMIALSNGHADVAQLLLAAGADISICNKTGWNALLVASARGPVFLLNLLFEFVFKLPPLDRRRLFHQVTDDGQDAITLAAISNQVECLRSLFDYTDGMVDPWKAATRAHRVAREQKIALSRDVISILNTYS
eukprot:TRINITY_DN4158_c0_g1_i5.p2 TRINITY_DN4158_c0_g1~~TRINITY_DN4158_c0_g1_i5.p2  ORF type:complete len:177 (-),score=35.30 TRINITY_DN4158_c0_g1_i5:289-819(-)